jgi:hypothetical protein
MQKRYIVRLSVEERSGLEALVRKGQAAAYKLTHARILLQSDQGTQGTAKPDAVIAENLQVAERTVARTRQRWVEGGLTAAIERQPQARPSRTPKFDGRAEAQLVQLACSQPPAGRARWTLQLLADRLVALQVFDTVSYETVRQTLKKTR